MNRFSRTALALAMAVATTPAMAHNVLFPHVHLAGQTFDIEMDVACSLLFGLILGSALTWALKALAAWLRKGGLQ